MLTMTNVSTAENQQIDRLLAVTRDTIAAIRYCWVATCALDGGANARAVRVFPGAEGADEWSRRFLTRRGSRKVAEIHLDPRVTLAYQHDSGDVYVALAGRVTLVDDKEAMRALWYGNVGAAFSDEFLDANMIVAHIEVDRIEIHARGVTAEPFGHGRTLIERDPEDGWRFVRD